MLVVLLREYFRLQPSSIRFAPRILCRGRFPVASPLFLCAKQTPCCIRRLPRPDITDKKASSGGDIQPSPPPLVGDPVSTPSSLPNPACSLSERRLYPGVTYHMVDSRQVSIFLRIHHLQTRQRALSITTSAKQEGCVVSGAPPLAQHDGEPDQSHTVVGARDNNM